jgi:hypothetical protein
MNITKMIKNEISTIQQLRVGLHKISYFLETVVEFAYVISKVAQNYSVEVCSFSDVSKGKLSNGSPALQFVVKYYRGHTIALVVEFCCSLIYPCKCLHYEVARNTGGGTAALPLSDFEIGSAVEYFARQL